MPGGGAAPCYDNREDDSKKRQLGTTELPSLTHFVSLQGPAGVELQFAEFVKRAAQRFPDWAHDWMNPDRSIDSTVNEHLGGALRRSFPAKYRWNVRLPSTPRGLRAWHCRRSLARGATDVVLIWNRTARTQFVLDAMHASRCMHFEHGAAWFPGREAERRRYFRSVPAAITNSRAAARVLELSWSYTGSITVCRNALRPSLLPGAPVDKTYPSGRPFRLGVAARLFPVKGVASAVQALKVLRDRSMPAELHVAGAGPERERLRALAASLELRDAVHFHGDVRRMSDFYTHVDCLVHTPLSEAFGLVAVEAAAHGCPVIAARVDGLPEAVTEDVSGLCVTPALSVADYTQIGGTGEHLPDYVYDPAGDALCRPRAVAPDDLADAVEALLASPQRFEALSRSASRHVLATCSFDRHVDELMHSVQQFARGAG